MKTKTKRVTVAASLQYAKAYENFVKSKMNGMAEQWCEDDQEAIFTRRVRNFSGNIYWREDEAGGGQVFKCFAACR